MTLGEFRKKTNFYLNELELVGEFSNNQNDIWKICLSKRNNDGIYQDIENPNTNNAMCGKLGLLIYVGYKENN